jgi:hypothetical protein
MSVRDWIVRLGAWLALAALVLWPMPLTPTTVLVGHPDVDVWNHAWGYWFVSHAIGEGMSPLQTTLLGAPDGGALFFIDFIGALIGTPIAWLFGAAAAYNGVLLLRVALAGMAAQTLSDVWTGRGVHGWVAGMAYASLPFLLCEMANGISEVASIHWVAWVLVAAERVRRDGHSRDWWRLGLLVGLCAAANFYYGLVAGMMVGVVALVDLATAWRGGDRPSKAFFRAVGGGIFAAVIVALPVWLAFRWSLSADDALIVRPKALAEGWMLSHNAVDPRTYFWPGDFQSVDLSEYGEAFRHTGYLRWSVLLLALVGAWTHRRLWVWAGVGLVCLILGLGPFLWWGEWVFAGGRHVSLPFYWLQLLLPDVAITHTLRLSIGGQLVLCVLAAGGLATLHRRFSRLVPTVTAVIVAGLVFFEGTQGSAAAWPIPSSDATVPDAFADLDEGPILDLPGSVGSTMATSRYFWYQTAHQRPIPYTPNARLDSCRDLDVPASFSNPHVRSSTHAVVEDPASGPDRLQVRLARRYAAIVLHTDLQARADLPSEYGPVLRSLFGEPDTVDDLLIWRFRGQR